VFPTIGFQIITEDYSLRISCLEIGKLAKCNLRVREPGRESNCCSQLFSGTCWACARPARENHWPALLIAPIASRERRTWTNNFNGPVPRQTESQNAKFPRALRKDGGAEGSRTPDLLIANQSLCQLSYDPIPPKAEQGYLLHKNPPRATTNMQIFVPGSAYAWRCRRRRGEASESGICETKRLETSSDPKRLVLVSYSIRLRELALRARSATGEVPERGCRSRSGKERCPARRCQASRCWLAVRLIHL
jgi:hypothetical protein